MTRTPGTNGRSDLVALSRRERDVLRLVVQGKRPADIGLALGLSEKTVRTYLFSLCQGLGLAGRTELALWGAQNPLALSRQPAHPGLHPSGCDCGGALCSVLSDSPERVEAAASV